MRDLKIHATKKYLFYLYYAVLLIIYIIRQNLMAEPPMVQRVMYMAAVLMPPIFVKEISYTAIVTMFLSLTLCGANFSYMPYTLSLYVIITIVLIPFLRVGKRKRLQIPPFLITFTLFIFIIDLVSGTMGGYKDSNIFEQNFLCLLLLILFIVVIGDDIEKNLEWFPICYAASTIVLSVLFLTIGQRMFMQAAGAGGERVMWTDPNYLGMAIAMGTIFGLMKLFSKEWKETAFFEKFVYLTAIIISIPVLLLNASRGSLLSIVVAFVILLGASKIKIKYKIILVFLAIVGIYYLYINEYLELLIARIENDDGTGSGRSSIWTNKLNAYFDGNIFQQIFGMGKVPGGYAGGTLVGFHNDYLGHLVDYGIIGGGFLLYLLCYPLLLTPKKSKSRSEVLVVIVYLAICFLTLEPFLTGILSYYVFYLYALLLAQNERNKLLIKPLNTNERKN